MSCISEFSFPLVNYFIFKNFQQRVRTFENEKLIFKVTLIEKLITCSFVETSNS